MTFVFKCSLKRS